MKLFYFIHKELLLIKRDLHGLLLLFVMPSVFILIMTFALQNQYSSSSDSQIDFYLISHSSDELSQEFIDSLNNTANFKRILSDKSEAELRPAVAADQASFFVVLSDNFSVRLANNERVLTLETAPGTTPVMIELIQSQLLQKVSQLFIKQNLADLLGDDDSGGSFEPANFINTKSLYNSNLQPSSVQQNVPAWLLFSMFFIAIPLSTTLINERQQGTLARLKTMGASQLTLFLGKLIPYFAINLLQVIAMLLIGIFLVPAIGGDKLQLGNSYGGLILISVCASIAAVTYALLIAQLADTVEQATILSGVCNIIMAAIGGVMVPRFIMPETMQAISNYSPMAWGLEGFLDIFLRNGNAASVVTESCYLLIFALSMLLLSLFIAARKQIRSH